MVPHVLGVGYAYNEYEVTAGRWKKFEIEFEIGRASCRERV